MAKSRNKSGNIFHISDTHFSHTKSWEVFKNPDGSPLRPFASDEEMNETMVDNWNRIIKPEDTVYHMGDVAIKKQGLEYVKRLNGRKILILGNHDILGNKLYIDAGFVRLHAYRVFVDEFICSHIPIHPDCISDRFVANVCGHLHGNIVMRDESYLYAHGANMKSIATRKVPDHRYKVVSVEQINFTPIAHEDLKIIIKKQYEDAGFEMPKSGWGNGSKPS